MGGVWKIAHRFQRVTLTCTHSFFVPRLVRAVVTVQSLVVIACVCLIAHLAHLPGAGLAAVAAVHEEAHARRARRGDAGTLAGPLAVLRAVVRVRGGGRGRQILGEGLEAGEQKEGVSPGGRCLWRNGGHSSHTEVILQSVETLESFHYYAEQSQGRCQEEQSSITVLASFSEKGSSLQNFGEAEMFMKNSSFREGPSTIG